MTLPFAATSRSEPALSPVAPRLQRTEGVARVAFKRVGRETRLDRLHQSGAAKVRRPHVPSGEPPQAVLINTAGGLTGGDRMAAEVALGAGCRAAVTTQACEKIYRSAGGAASVAARLTVGEGARLDWLPQETILFDGARLSRTLEVNLAPAATLLIVESLIFGRAARGEAVRSGLFTDRWRIRRQGSLVFADDLRFDWARADLLGRPAVLAGAGAMATILYVGAESERHLEAMRASIGDTGGASAFGGKLLARVTAEGGAALRRVLIPGLVGLLDGAALPTIWQI
ncbi:MAG: urease accessory protein UreD [Propylenella sp.]